MSLVGTRLAALPTEKRRLVFERLASKKQSSKIPLRSHRTGPAPLSYAQQRFWLLQQLDPSSVQYNLPAAMRIDGPVDAGILACCFAEIIRRHESLRTTFTTVAGEPMQFIAPAGDFQLAVADVADPQELVARMEAHAGTPFHLEQGPLFRAELLRVNAREHVLLLNAHHIISDGWSAGVLLRELLGLYESFEGGNTPSLPLPVIQYADFATWQMDPAQESVIDVAAPLLAGTALRRTAGAGTACGPPAPHSAHFPRRAPQTGAARSGNGELEIAEPA